MYPCRLAHKRWKMPRNRCHPCLATLRDRGTSDQITLDQHSLTHFPSQLWCKACVESRGRDSHREPSKIDAVVPQLQFDYGYIEDGDPLLIARFLVDSKKMDMPHAVAGTVGA